MEASAKLKDLRNHVLRLDTLNLRGMKRRVEVLQKQISEERREEFTASLPYSKEEIKNRAKLSFLDREPKQICEEG